MNNILLTPPKTSSQEDFYTFSMFVSSFHAGNIKSIYSQLLAYKKRHNLGQYPIIKIFTRDTDKKEIISVAYEKNNMNAIIG